MRPPSEVVFVGLKTRGILLWNPYHCPIPFLRYPLLNVNITRITIFYGYINYIWPCSMANCWFTRGYLKANIDPRWRFLNFWGIPKIGLNTMFWLDSYGGFHKLGIPNSWMVYNSKSIYTWTIWGYHNFRKPPHSNHNNHPSLDAILKHNINQNHQIDLPNICSQISIHWTPVAPGFSKPLIHQSYFLLALISPCWLGFASIFAICLLATSHNNYTISGLSIC